MLAQKKTPRTTVTVGISAFNEGQTLPSLLQDIINQKTESFQIKKILVISDGSTDQTAKVVRALAKENSLIEFIQGKERRGLGNRLNQIFELTTTDQLILLNADIRILDSNCFNDIITTMSSQKADLVSCTQIPLPPQTTFEKMLTASMDFKNALFAEYLDGQNLFTCHGTIRGFSRALYQRMRFPYSVGEDGFSYLFAKQQNFTYAFCATTQVFYREPQNQVDYFRQVQRYRHSLELHQSYFGKAFVQHHYQLPIFHTLKHLFIFSVTNPLQFIQYLAFSIYIRLQPLPQQHQQTWVISRTSKNTNL